MNFMGGDRSNGNNHSPYMMPGRRGRGNRGGNSNGNGSGMVYLKIDRLKFLQIQQQASQLSSYNYDNRKMSYDDIKYAIGMFVDFIDSADIIDNPMANSNNGMSMNMIPGPAAYPNPNPNPMMGNIGMPFMNNYNNYNGNNLQEMAMSMGMGMGMGVSIGMGLPSMNNGRKAIQSGRRLGQRSRGHRARGRGSGRRGYADDADDDEEDYQNEFDFGDMINTQSGMKGPGFTEGKNKKKKKKKKAAEEEARRLEEERLRREEEERRRIEEEERRREEERLRAIEAKYDQSVNPNVLKSESFIAMFGDKDDPDNNGLDFQFTGDLTTMDKELADDEIEDESKEDDDDDNDNDTISLYRGTFTLPMVFDQDGNLVRYKIALRGGDVEDPDEGLYRGQMAVKIDGIYTVLCRWEDVVVSPNPNENKGVYGNLVSYQTKMVGGKHVKVKPETSIVNDDGFDYISNNSVTFEIPSNSVSVDTMFARLVDVYGNPIPGCNWNMIEMTALAGKRMKEARMNGSEPDIFTHDCDPALKEETLNSLQYLGDCYSNVELITELEPGVGILSFESTFGDWDETRDEDNDSNNDKKKKKKKKKKIGNWIKKRTKTIRNVVKDVGHFADQAISHTASVAGLDDEWNAIKQGFVKTTALVSKGFKTMVKAIKGFVAKGIGFVKNALKKLLEWISMFWDFMDIARLAKGIKYTMCITANTFALKPINLLANWLKKELDASIGFIWDSVRIVNSSKTSEVRDERSGLEKTIADIAMTAMRMREQGVTLTDVASVVPMAKKLDKMINKTLDFKNLFNASKFEKVMKDFGKRISWKLREKVNSVVWWLLRGSKDLLLDIVRGKFSISKMFKTIWQMVHKQLKSIIDIFGEIITLFLDALSTVEFEDLFPTFKNNFLKDFILFISGGNVSTGGMGNAPGMLDIMSYMTAFAVFLMDTAISQGQSNLGAFFKDKKKNKDLCNGLSNAVFGNDSVSDDDDDDDDDDITVMHGKQQPKFSRAGNGGNNNSTKWTAEDQRRVDAKMVGYWIKSLFSIHSTLISAATLTKKSKKGSDKATVRGVAALVSNFMPIIATMYNSAAFILGTDFSNKNYLNISDHNTKAYRVSLVTLIANWIMVCWSVPFGDHNEDVAKIFNWIFSIIRNIAVATINFVFANDKNKTKSQQKQHYIVGSACVIRIAHILADITIWRTKNPWAMAAAGLCGTINTSLFAAATMIAARSQHQHITTIIE